MYPTFLFKLLVKRLKEKITMYEAQILINEHYAQMNSNRSSYEIVPLDSEESKRITEYNKARRQNCINNGQCYN